MGETGRLGRLQYTAPPVDELGSGSGKLAAEGVIFRRPQHHASRSDQRCPPITLEHEVDPFGPGYRRPAEAMPIRHFAPPLWRFVHGGRSDAAIARHYTTSVGTRLGVARPGRGPATICRGSRCSIITDISPAGSAHLAGPGRSVSEQSAAHCVAHGKWRARKPLGMRLSMASDLRDKRQFFRFFGVNILGMIADYLLARLYWLSVFSVHPTCLPASTCGFMSWGRFVNYCGHNIFSYEHTSRETISVCGVSGSTFWRFFSSLAGAARCTVAALDYLSPYCHSG